MSLVISDIKEDELTEKDCIVKCQTIQSGAIRNLIEALKDILTDVNITFDQSGIKIMEIDGNGICLVHMFLQAQQFELYECNERVNASVSMGTFYKNVIKSVNHNDIISFYILREESNKLIVEYQNTEKSTRTKFKYQLLDIFMKRIQIPEIQFDCILTMPATDFQHYCRDMSNVSDVLHIQSNDKTLLLICKGNSGERITEITESNNDNQHNGGQHGLIMSRQNTIAEGKFYLKYLTLFTKATGLHSTVDIYLKTGFPLIICYHVGNLGTLRFCLSQVNDTEETD